MYERIFDISKMIAKIDIMIFCNIAPHSEKFTFSFVFSSKDPTCCCERLHTSAKTTQQDTTLLGPTMFRVVASVCTGL